MPPRRCIPPMRGVSDAMPFVEQVGDLVPPANLLNMRVDASRRRLSKRPGLAKRFAAAIGSGNPVQAMGVVTKAATISGYTVGTCSDVGADWTNQSSGPITGNAWLLRSNLAMYAEEAFGTAGVNCCAFSPDGTKVVLGTVDTGGANDVGKVRMISATDAATVWTHDISEASVDRFVNTVEVTADYVFVTTNEHVRVLNYADGTLVQEYDLKGWAQEAVEARVSADGRYLLVAFIGGGTAATLPSGQAVTAGKYGAHFRSGIARYRIDVGEASPLVWLRYGSQPTTDYWFYEAAKGYLRFSEAFLYGSLVAGGVTAWPTTNVTTLQGCLPTALATCPDGGVVVTHTNQGWGPTASYPPNGSGRPYRTVTKFDAAGNLLWQVDTDSIRELGDGGLINDIPTSSSDDPSILAVAVGTDGTVYCAGRRTPIGEADVFALDGDSGIELWSQDLGTTIRQAALVVSPFDGAVWAAGDRSTTWPDASGAHANLWKLGAGDGGVLAHYDLNAGVSGLGVDVNASGDVCYGTDFV